MAKGIAHVRRCALVLTVIERRDRRQHRLLGRVQGLDPLTDDPLESLGDLACQPDERLLETRDLERILGEGLVRRLVLRQPRGPVQVEPLAGDQLIQSRELVIGLHSSSPLSRHLVVAFERPDVDIAQVGLRPPRRRDSCPRRRHSRSSYPSDEAASFSRSSISSSAAVV